jgi:hypothetical protein
MIGTSAMRIALFGLLAIVGCKSGLNERCQVQADCTNGLVCVQSIPGTGFCQESSATGQIDATVPDAPATQPVTQD